MSGKAETICTVLHPDIVKYVRGQLPERIEMNQLANLFKLFADQTRIRIMCALSYEEMCVCDIAMLLDMTKSAISHQLKLLRMGNLVKARKSGKSVYYTLADQHVHQLFAIGFEHNAEGRM